MSNEIYVSRTRFETLDEAGNVISTTYGARIYDDLECTYVNLHQTLDELLALGAAELVDYVKDHSEMGTEMLSASDFSRLFVDDEWGERATGERRADVPLVPRQIQRKR